MNERIGRCQHCQQIRPLFYHFTSSFHAEPPDDCWVPPLPPAPLESWLCARDWSDAEEADQTGKAFHIERDLIVWPEVYEKARRARLNREIQAERDWNACRDILRATKEAEANA